MRKGGSAHDRRDARDQWLLDSRDYWTLLASYYDVTRERCSIRLRSREDGTEAAHEVIIRLVQELERGKRYTAPFRVVVYWVTNWILQGWPRVADSVGLPDELDLVGPDPFQECDSTFYLRWLFKDLPKREREVVESLYVRRVEPRQIAEQLGMTVNAVYQALHRAHKKLREKLGEELRV